TQLAAVRMRVSDPKAHVVLPESLSMEPLAISVRAGDDGWANVVRWTFFSVVAAPVLEAASTSVRVTRAVRRNPCIMQLPGLAPKLGVCAERLTAGVEQQAGGLPGPTTAGAGPL